MAFSLLAISCTTVYNQQHKKGRSPHSTTDATEEASEQNKVANALPTISSITAKPNRLGILNVKIKVLSSRKLFGNGDQMLQIMADCGGAKDSTMHGLVILEQEKEITDKLFVRKPLPLHKYNQQKLQCRLTLRYGSIDGLNSTSTTESRPDVHILGEYCFENGIPCPQ